MPDPTPYTPGFDYSDFENSQPTEPKPGGELDNDFANISRTTNETIAALKDVRRSDGRMNNGVVHWETLDAQLQSIFTNGEVVEIYLGPHATPPTMRNDGTPLQEGDIYFDTVSDRLYVWDGTAWISGLAGIMFSVPATFTGTGAQTTFVLPILVQNSAQVIVWINDEHKIPDTEYIAAGNILTIGPAPANGAQINVLCLPVTSYADLQALVTAAQAAQTAAENALALMNGALGAVALPPYQPFPSRAAALAATIPDNFGFLDIRGARFRRDPAGTALVTADGDDWDVEGVLTPFHFGAVPNDMDNDQSAAFNAMTAWLRTQYSTASGSFKFQIDLCGLAWRVDSWNMTNIRQPAVSFGNGTIVSFGTGRTAVDCAGTNHGRIFGEFSIEAPDRTRSPRVGLFIGRAAFGGNPSPISPDWSGNVRIDGYFSKAGFINLASEVCSIKPHVTNRSRSLTAVGVAVTGHMGTIDEFLGGLTSEFCTLPTAADGPMSNILHDMGQLVSKRASDATLPILGLTRANPAVLTVDPALLAASGWTAGSVIYLHDHGGMSQIKHRNLVIHAANTVTGQLTLYEAGDVTPVNSTSYDAWTGGGNVWTSTGPSLLLGNLRGFRTSAAYLLTYGGPSVIIDCSRGTSSDVTLDFQQEASPPQVIRASVGSANALIQGMKLNILNANQSPGDSFLRIAGTGTLRIDNLDMTIQGAYSGSPSGGIFGAVGLLTLRNALLRFPHAADVQWSGYQFFSGTIMAADPVIMRMIYNNVYGASATSGQLQSLASQINTVGKFEGLPVWATDADRVVFAAGGTPSATWRASDGTVVYTPV